MEEATDLACIICCSSDCEDFQGLTFHLSGEEDEEEGDNRYNKWIFKQFCSQLLSIQSLELERSLSVCSACLDDLTRVVDTKSKVDAVESRVRKLQRSILMEMKELQGFMSTLKEQLKKIEDSVRISNGEAIFKHGRMSRTKRGQMTICKDGNGADFFRKSISESTTNLHTFSGDLSKRFPNNGTVNTRSGTTDQINYGGDTEDFKFDSSQPANYEWCNLEVETYGDGEDAHEIGSGINSPVVSLSDDKESIPVFHTDQSKENKRIILSDSDGDYDNLCKTKQYQRNSHTSLARRRNYEGPKVETSDMREEELGRGKRRRVSSMKLAGSMKKILLSEDDHCDDEDDDEDDDQNDGNYEPVIAVDKDDMPLFSPQLPLASSSPVALKVVPKVKLVKNPALEQIDFTGMNIFKKYVIQCLLNSIIKPNDDDQLLDPDSAEFYLRQAQQEWMSAMIEYEPELDKLHLKGVELLINEEEKTVGCSECSYKLNVTWSLNSKKERLWFTKVGKMQLKSHILNSHHPNVFNCQLCPSGKTFGNKLKSYIRHLGIHKNSLPFKCAICGRPVGSVRSLKTHLRTHMSMEEKEEVDSVGEAYHCSKCGKSYPDQSHLKQHQKSHIPKELKESESILCPICGKATAKTYYKIHRAKYCSGLGAPRINCHFCEKTFKNDIVMRRHLQRTHSQDAQTRPFSCDRCPRRFKVKWELTHHMKIHGERIYLCDKPGCGKGFSVKRNLKNHQFKGCKKPPKTKRESKKT